MAVHHGKDGVVKVGTNVIGSVIAWKFTGKIDLVEKAVMGDSGKSYLTGLTDATGTLDCLLDPSDSTGQEALTIGAAVTLHLFPQGTGGTVGWTITAIIEQLDGQASMTEASKRSFTWRNNGTAPVWSAT